MFFPVLTTTDVDASSSSDYQPINQQITFNANEDKITIQLSISEDDLVEQREFFRLTLSQPDGGVIGNPGSATATITDNDCKL